MDLTDIQWQTLKQFIPDDPVRADGRGRPWGDQRPALDGILWILRTGAPWQDLPARYGPASTVHRRFQNWRKAGVLEAVLRGLARDLHERGGFDLSECFIDGSFSAAKKGALRSAKPSGARASKSWQLETLMVFHWPFTQRLLRQRK
jgi:transposase